MDDQTRSLYADRCLRRYRDTAIVCLKSAGHTEAKDPRRRGHFDPDSETFWTDEEEDHDETR